MIRLPDMITKGAEIDYGHYKNGLYLGATFVGLFCAVTGRPLCQIALRVRQAWSPRWFTRWFGGSAQISWSMAFVSALLGTYSHVVLDSIMHRDMTPFAPLTSSNPMLDLIGIGFLHLMCFGLGVIGVLVIALRTVTDDRSA